MSWRDKTNHKRMEVFIPPESIKKLDTMCKDHQRSRAQIITMLIDTGSIPELDNKGNEMLSLLVEIRDKIDRLQSTHASIESTLTAIPDNQHETSTVSVPVSIETDYASPSHDDIMKLADDLYGESGSWSEVSKDLNKLNQLNNGKKWVANSIKTAVSKWNKGHQ